MSLIIKQFNAFFEGIHLEFEAAEASDETSLNKVWRYFYPRADDWWQIMIAHETDQKYIKEAFIPFLRSLSVDTSEQDRHLAFWAIFLMERHGCIPSDDRNGVTMWLQDGNKLFFLNSARLIDQFFEVHPWPEP